MKKKFQKAISILTLILVIPYIIAKILPFQDVNDQYIVRGDFNSELLHLSSIEEFEKRLSQVPEEKEKLWVDSLDSLLRFRFYHGTCRYNFSENYLAYSLGILFWDDFRMIVDPDEILKKKVAVCNQMNIVFQRILKNHSIRYRSVGLNHHLVTEVYYNNAWHIYDADYEPNFIQRPSVKDLLENRSMFTEIYTKTEGASFNPHFNEILESQKAIYYKENTDLAVKLRLFQQITYYISEYGWMALLLLGVFMKYL